MIMVLNINSEQWLDTKDLPNEEWKDIELYENLYQVSNYGRIKSLSLRNRQCFIKREKILSQSKDKDGYLSVRLSRNNKQKQYRVHQLVGKYFVDNPDDKPIFNHLEPVTRDYCNNHYTNLKPSTYSENIKYAYELGTKPKKNQFKGMQGSKSPFSKKVNQYDLNGVFIKTWDSMMDVERELGYNHSLISACCGHKRRMKTYKGFIWKYDKERENDKNENKIEFKK